MACRCVLLDLELVFLNFELFTNMENLTIGKYLTFKKNLTLIFLRKYERESRNSASGNKARSHLFRKLPSCLSGA